MRTFKNKKPSLRQIKAHHYLSQGMSKRKAMITAGYAINTANLGERSLKAGENRLKSFKEKMSEELLKQGLTPEYMSGKIKEWTEASDSKGNPDWDVQIRAFDKWKDAFSTETPLSEGNQKVSKKITLEEFWQS